LDFGLAKLAGAVTKLTASSVVLGTPGYMPPEQAGGSEFVDARSDVYALGSTLYYAICGRAPFEGNNAYQVLTEILRSPPLPPSSWNPEAEGPLDEICLRCLEKESDRRFQTAGELASVLDRYLVEKPSVPRRKPGAAKARRPSPAQEPPRRRSRWLVALPALLVGAGLGAGIRSLALTDSAPLQGEGEALGKALERALLRVAWTRVQVEDERLDDAIATLETFQREFGPTTAARELAPRLESLKRRAVGRALAGHGIEEAKLARTIALLDAYASDPEAASVASDAAARLADLRLVARQKVTWKKGSLSMCGTLAEGLSQVQDGETLRLESGEFSLPPVTIARSVRIEGAGLSRTRIVGKGDGFVLRFEGNGKLALSGITFEHKGAPSADVVVVAGGEVEIRGCAFTGLLDVPDVEPSAGRPTVRLVVREGGAGLRMTGSATGVVADCIFTRNSCGIVFAGQSSGSATHVTCTGNYFGLAVQGEATPSLRGCSCEKDHVGVIFLEQAAGTANGNECSSCYAGIAVAGTARPLASGNTCRKNVHGVVVCQSALPALERNACSENGQAGIDYQDEAAGTASSNLCSQNGVFGIRVADKGRPTLEKNICRENGESGLGFSGDAGGLATANTSVVNARFGVRMRERAQTVLRENFFFGNKEKDMSDERSR
ncbi:right-handed parallel beta-helix repeat-containing protein, partial [bacterium]|nr:right-handed parallel beta-helix repeat-containing protein [bacterium]